MSIEVDLAGDAVRLRAEADRPGGPGRRPALVAVGASETGTTGRTEEVLAEGSGRD